MLLSVIANGCQFCGVEQELLGKEKCPIQWDMIDVDNILQETQTNPWKKSKYGSYD